MIIGVPALWWVKQPLGSSTGVGRTQPCPATQYAARSMTTTLAPYQIWTGGIVRRVYPIVLRIIPIRAPFMHLARHPSYPTPTHVCWILLCWSWSFDLGNMVRSPGRGWVATIRPGSSAGQPCPPGGVCVKGETCNFIGAAAPAWFPGIAPRKEKALRPTSGILPLRFRREPHLCPGTVRSGILPGNGTHRQLPGSWARTAVEPGAIVFPMHVRVNGAGYPVACIK
jgi:hypothetical protein